MSDKTQSMIFYARMHAGNKGAPTMQIYACKEEEWPEMCDRMADFPVKADRFFLSQIDVPLPPDEWVKSEGERQQTAWLAAEAGPGG